MSNAGHFNNKHVQEEKKPRFFADFKVALRREADGSLIKVQGGKIVSREPAAHMKESKHVAKVDVSKEESKFYKPTTVSTIVEKMREGEKSTETERFGERETVARVRKPLDVNARALKL
jgi:hypothetical protein